MGSHKRSASENQALLLTVAFSIYAACSLISMATMSIGVGIVLMALLVALGGPAGFWRALRAEALSPNGRIYLAATVALVAACLISLGVAAADPVSYGGKLVPVRAHDFAKLWYLFWPLALAAGLARVGARGQRIVLRTWFLALGVLSAIGVAQYFTGWPRQQPIPGNPGHFHAIVFLGHHLSVASIFIFPFFAALDELSRSLRHADEESVQEKPLLPAPVLALIVVLALVTLFFTYSRMLWVALPAGLLAWLVATLRNRWALLGAFVILLVAGAAMQMPQVAHRLHASIGVNEREDLWKANVNFFLERPVTGIGFTHNEELSAYYLQSLRYPGADVFSGHAHNNFLQMLGATGLLGAAAWVAWCCVIFLLLYPLALRPEPVGFSVGLLCAWLVFQMNGITQVNFWEGKVEHQMAWAVAWSLVWAGRSARSVGTKPRAA